VTGVTEPVSADGAQVGSETTLRWAVRLIAVQTVALTVVTAFLAWSSAVHRTTTLRMALSVTGYALVITVALGLLGVSLHRRRRWARGPAIVLELLQVPIGYGMLTGGLPFVGAPVLLVSLCAAGLLLAPTTRFALARR
jgi:hypothetical protein